MARAGAGRRLALSAMDGGADAVVTRYGETRLDASRVLAEVSPATVATGIDLCLARPVDWACRPGGGLGG